MITQTENNNSVETSAKFHLEFDDDNTTTTKTEETVERSVAFTEDEYVKLLANKNFDPNNIDFTLIDAEDKEKIDFMVADIEAFIANNVDFKNYDEATKDKLFAELTEVKWKELSSLTKNAKNKFRVSGLEVSVIEKKLHQNIDYNAETIFYGVHLKNQFFTTLPVKTDITKAYDLTITFSVAVMLYHLLSTVTVKGLNKEAFAYANVLYKLSEVSKLYTYYNNLSEMTSKKIGNWNRELSADDAQLLEKAVTLQMIEEETAKANAETQQ